MLEVLRADTPDALIRVAATKVILDDESERDRALAGLLAVFKR